MYHSLNIGKHIVQDTDDEGKLILTGCKNTTDDFFIVPTSRPVFEPPEPKSTVIDIPGFDGVIDLSESLTGFPIFNNRKGSIEFAVLNDKADWITIYNAILSYVHGRYLECVMEDDPGYKYKGRFSVESWNSNNDGTWSTITLNYDIEPYKLSIESSIDDWLWDPFDFETGVIRKDIFYEIDIDTRNPETGEYEWSEEFVYTGMIGRKPIVPTFIVSSADATSGSNNNVMQVWLYDSDFDDKEFDETDTSRIKSLNDGENIFYDFVMCDLNEDSVIKMKFKGKGLVSISFNSGDL